jgi:hypothetical protein
MVKLALIVSQDQDCAVKRLHERLPSRLTQSALRHTEQFARIEKTVGVLLVATGVAFLTGGFQSVSLWLIETFPQFSQIG